MKGTVMDEELKYKIDFILNPPKTTGVFSEDDIITQDIVNYLRSLENQSRLPSLFIRTNRPREQKIEKKCYICGNVFLVLDSLTGCVNYIKRDRFCCQQCKNIALLEQKKLYQQKMDEREKQRTERTKEYIDNYLDPTKHWSDGVKTWAKLQQLKDDVNYDMVAAHIQDMPYRDFLTTPYWVAIAEKVKQKNNFRCEMCGAHTRYLNVHHPTYDFHGYELQNINKLRCLCADCHELFHNN